MVFVVFSLLQPFERISYNQKSIPIFSVEKSEPAGILPHWYYCCPVWRNNSQTPINKPLRKYYLVIFPCPSSWFFLSLLIQHCATVHNQQTQFKKQPNTIKIIISMIWRGLSYFICDPDGNRTRVSTLSRQALACSGSRSRFYREREKGSVYLYSYLCDPDGNRTRVSTLKG